MDQTKFRTTNFIDIKSDFDYYGMPDGTAVKQYRYEIAAGLRDTEGKDWAAEKITYLGLGDLITLRNELDKFIAQEKLLGHTS